MMIDSIDYVGTELEVFAHAKNWRSYWKSQIQPFIGRTVLEVGAGIGTVTRNCCDESVQRWVALEPDVGMAERLRHDCQNGLLPKKCEVKHGSLATLPNSEVFESVLYIDVLEHIDDDRDEVLRASNHLVPGGYLIILVPAHQYLYSPFDAAIGHFRRYGRKSLTDLRPKDMSLVSARYLDSVGFLASVTNKLFLKQSNPTLKQVLFWDKVLVRASKVMDVLLRYGFGKSLVVVWKKVS
jgi:SAM-dependent methyltransferase